MPQSPCHLFKNSMEFMPSAKIASVPTRVRGIYVLYQEGKDKVMDVVYIGLARGGETGVKRRIKTHQKSKKDLWTHFSVFEVWDNVSEREIEELEGLFRHLYRFDAAANKLNVQKTYKPLSAISRAPKEWV